MSAFVMEEKEAPAVEETAGLRRLSLDSIRSSSSAGGASPEGLAAERERLSSAVTVGSMNEMRIRFPTAPEVAWLRFLKAHNSDITKAAAAFGHHLEWRASLGADLREAAWEEIGKGKFYQRGQALNGSPVCWWETAKNDPKVRDQETMLKAAMFWCIHIEQVLDAKGPEANRSFIFVIDRVHNVLDLSFLLAAVPVLQENFPERLSAIYVAPSSFALRAIWGMVQPLLNKETRALVKFVGTCHELQQYIAPDQLPTRMGGTDTWTFDAAREGAVPDLGEPSEWQTISSGYQATN